ncbi:Arginine/lysine/ornithine decarboxylase [hydrothermal vent metagenome]|uniref:Arginine/lysine/ornithine decarboxylase n=1 Tax=hydrothermal vent metagenome TaxID=652676 RepID=A0A3B0XIC2_9ZZZZ
MTYKAPIFDLESHRLDLWKTLYQTSETEDIQQINNELETIFKIEYYWAYPGYETLFQLREYIKNEDRSAFRLLCGNLLNSLINKTYRAREFIPFQTNLNNLDKPQSNLLASNYSDKEKNKTLKPYFEVLIIHPAPHEYELLYRNSLANYITFHDQSLYDILFVDNYYDAIIAILSNPTIQACIYIDNFKIKSDRACVFEEEFSPFLQGIENSTDQQSILLKKHISHLRPDLDNYYICEDYATELQLETFDRIIYTQSPNFFADIHHHILSGIEQRFSTPFFDALRSYAKRPKGAFHALPISQGQSIQSSYWIRDVADFYGEGIFSAETSSTLGGMDSIMDPKGSISQAQNKASDLFQSKSSYFVTNGTTTANKIVMQANLHPDDIVLVSSDCHKSIPYSVLLSGAKPIFLETYPLNQYDLYGCVTLNRIKQVLLDLKKQKQLHRVKQITLTNSTFDGIIYDVKRYMMDILAIKPDIIFHWDEAWFSFGYFNPLFRGKTAMSAANALSSMLKSDEYRHIYEQWEQKSDIDDDDFLLNNDLYPDPKQFKIRVYATHSVHKTLTAFRQASMLHTHDCEFSEDDFYEAYRTHTSTSPNYQIIASLDFARRQMSLEGYELVKNSLLLAWQLRQKIQNSEHLNRYFKVLGDRQMIPSEYLDTTETDKQHTMHYPDLYRTFRKQVFSVDPTRITLDISATGIDGPNFRQMLMTQYDIQVNKTSKNTILIIINIGVDKHSIQYLIESLCHIASKLKNNSKAVEQNTNIINLPLTRNYHKKFVAVQSHKNNNFQAVEIRNAYYAGLKSENIEYVPLSTELIQQVMNDKQLVCAGFITPYPPGFPIIVPGQLITYDIFIYLKNIQIKEIHGYHAKKGLKIFTADFLQD